MAYGKMRKVEARMETPPQGVVLEWRERPDRSVRIIPRGEFPPDFGPEVKPPITEREIKGVERKDRLIGREEIFRLPLSEIFLQRRFGTPFDRAERTIRVAQLSGLLPQNLSPLEKFALVQAPLNSPQTQRPAEPIKSPAIDQKTNEPTNWLGLFSLQTSFSTVQAERSKALEENEQTTQVPFDLRVIIEELCAIPARLAVEFAKMAAREAEADKLAFKRAEKRLDQERQDLRNLRIKQERIRQELIRAQQKANDLAA